MNLLKKNLFLKKICLKKIFSWKKFFLTILITAIFSLIYFIYYLVIPFKTFVPNAFTLAGFFKEKNYLVLVQNNSERRPSGGFITAYLEVSCFLGYCQKNIKDSYDIPAPKNQINPPYPLDEILSKDQYYQGFVFRDANWSPDFPTSVKQILHFYKKTNPKTINGVFTIDFTVIEKLFEITGNIVIKEEEFNAQNIFHKMQFYSKNIDLHSIKALHERKNIMKQIAPALLKNLLKKPKNYKKISNLIKNLLDNKHIQLYFLDKKLETKVKNQKWGWIFNPISEDFLHINIANIGGRKADRYLDPLYEYQVIFDEQNQAHANLSITFDYNATQGLYTDFYQAYVRVYVPKKILNLKHWGDNKTPFKIESDLEATSIGTLIHLWPQETQVLHFSYDLPPTVLPYEYNLDLIPIAGNFGEQWNIAVIAHNNDNFWQSDDFLVKENLASYRNIIQKNVTLKTELLKDKTPPVIIWQKFLDKNLIEILWSEKLDPNDLKLENFFIKDKNINKKEISETPTIVSVQQENHKMTLQLENISWQLEEHFSLTMKDLSDLSGNYIEPNLKEITLVQR